MRGEGLFLGIELVRNRSTREAAPAEADYVVERMREEGMLASVDGLLRNVIRIKPPLVIGPADVDRYVATLDSILREDFIVARISS